MVITKVAEDPNRNIAKTKRLNVNRKPPKGPIDPECVIEEKCTVEQVPYKLVSGDGMDKYPQICFNGKL